MPNKHVSVQLNAKLHIGEWLASTDKFYATAVGKKLLEFECAVRVFSFYDLNQGTSSELGRIFKTKRQESFDRLERTRTEFVELLKTKIHGRKR